MTQKYRGKLSLKFIDKGRFAGMDSRLGLEGQDSLVLEVGGRELILRNASVASPSAFIESLVSWIIESYKRRAYSDSKKHIVSESEGKIALVDKFTREDILGMLLGKEEVEVSGFEWNGFLIIDYLTTYLPGKSDEDYYLNWGGSV